MSIVSSTLPMFKVCNGCQEQKPLSAFPRAPEREGVEHFYSDGYLARCKSCQHAYERATRKPRSPQGQAGQRNAHYQRTFGITLTEYETMYKVQHGRCAACRRPETKRDKRTGQIKNLAVDHNHTTGEVRSLLCSGCNIALGHLGESQSRARALLGYMKRIQATQQLEKPLQMELFA